MPVVAVTGCPGAGKSVVSDLFAESGAEVVSGDAIGKDVIDHDIEIRNALTAMFGEDIIDDEGNLNRKLLGKRAFSSKENLHSLNRIVHPALLMELRNRIEIHRRNSPEKLLIVDAALIYEWGIADWFDAVVTVYADYWIRIKRLKETGLTDAEAADRTDSQVDQDEKIKRADYTIENNGLLHELERAVKKLYPVLLNK
jgi:dephospho-CoA kinase